MPERHRFWWRKLPHLEVTGSTYFVTWSLRPEVQPLSPQERKLVLDGCLFWHRRRWALHTIVVMPTHVHVLATPLQETAGSAVRLEDVIQSVKGYSAHAINEMRERKGSLWLDEYRDEMIRDGAKMEEVYNYVWQNPVRERLAESAEEYPFFWVDAEFFK